MRGAIGNAMVMNIVITFIILTTAFLVGSISYSKAFKIKSKMIDIIEKHEGDFNKLVETVGNSGNKSQIMYEIEEMLGETGYRTSNGNTCNGGDIAESSNYDICIYEINSTGTDEVHNSYRGPHYKVVAYMYFDFPIIGDMIKIPVSGETRSYFLPVE